MPKFQVAHVREQGVDLIIIPLQPTFAHRSQRQKQATIDELQARASAAGLAGTVVPVWRSGSIFNFVAPRSYHPFFKSIDWNWVSRNVNRQLFW
jgi:hypothetical protein